MLRSIRTRILLWYLGILAVILVLLAGATYFTMRRTLHENLDDGIENRAFLTQQLLTFGTDGEPRLGLSESDPNLDDSYQRVFGADGQILFDNSATFGAGPSDPDAVERALNGQRDWATAESGETEARVLTLPISHESEIVGALQVGESTGDVRDTLRSLLVVFAAALPGALVLAAGGGWWLSTRALSPIDAMTRAAQEISEQDLSRRLGLDLPDDEVGRLARTFDGMIARLEAAFARQRQFTADASHELRTPLTAMRGQIEVALQRPREPDAYREVLATINEQVDRMTRLVCGLLTLARVDAGALLVQWGRVDLGELARSAAGQVRPLGAQKGLSVEASGEGSAVVEGDEDLLLQLVLNLADNANKYTASGSVTVGWRGGERPAVWVRDTGAGIATEDQGRIFERFYRLDVARSRDEGGAGLGLAICRSIAEAHGAALTVESGAGGSTFTVTFPSPARG